MELKTRLHKAWTPTGGRRRNWARRPRRLIPAAWSRRRHRNSEKREP